MFCVRGSVSGRVQGVGFRYFVKHHADTQQVYGYAKNLSDGRVQFLLQGERSAVQLVLGQIRRGPSYSRVNDVNVEEVEAGEVENRFLTL